MTAHEIVQCLLRRGVSAEVLSVDFHMPSLCLRFPDDVRFADARRVLPVNIHGVLHGG